LYDFEYMMKAYSSWRELAELGLQIGLIKAKETAERYYGGSFRKLLVIGIGGSGIIGDYLRGLSEHYEFTVDVNVVRSVTVSNYLSRDSLVMVISYSGDTVETIKALDSLKGMPVKLVGVTSGGLLEKALQKEDAVILKMPGGYPSRGAFPLMFYSVLSYLSYLQLTGKLSINDVMNSVNVFENTDAVLKTASSIAEASSKDKFFITTHHEYMPIASRLKKELSENAKVLAIAEEYPEWLHNTLEGMPKDDLDIISIEGGLTSSYKCFLEAAEKTLGTSSIKIRLSGRNVLEEYIYGTWLSGYISLMLARRRNVNPRLTSKLNYYREIVSKACV